MDQLIELTDDHTVAVSGIGPPGPGRLVMLPDEAHMTISPPPANLPVDEIQLTVVSWPAGLLTVQGWGKLAGSDRYNVGVKARIIGDQLTLLVRIDPDDVED
jgi:hypothetical protein